MSKKLDLLSARSLILASALVFIVSVVVMCVSMLRPHDSGGLARNTYGTRGAGYRGLFEVLEAIGVSVSRDLAPPRAATDTRHTLVLINPHPRLVATGPKYIIGLRNWIERGGRVVVTPSTSHDLFAAWTGKDNEKAGVDILRALEIDDQVSIGEMSEDYVEQDFTSKESRNNRTGAGSNNNTSSFPRAFGSGQHFMPPRRVGAMLGGSLKSIADEIKNLAVPGEGFLTLGGKPDELAGWLQLTGSDGKPHLFVAVVRHGAGEIVVVAEPAILSNRLIAEADNSVLAAQLIAPRGEAAVFDEFYHGLSVRGNPFYLLTRAGFAATTVGLLLLVGAAAWRSAVFLGPPLHQAKRSRRDIGEYISAMAQFFNRGRGSRRFLASEVRDGVLRQICHELKLPMDTLHLDVIVRALARRDRERAGRLEDAVHDVNAALIGDGEFPNQSFVPAMRRLTSCL